MRNDFCVFILTHGRPGRLHTYGTLKRRGYTGKVYIVIDDEDPTADEYVRRYGDQVLVFSKEDVSKTMDEGDNFNDRRAIIYARNVCFDLAEKVGCRYFMQLDDDYTYFAWRFNESAEFGYWPINDFDSYLEIMLDYYTSIPALSIAMWQGGDLLGGPGGQFGKRIGSKRKAMNSFICSTDRRFQFFGRINEDVNTYTTLGRRGELFLTCGTASLNQVTTQKSEGGMTEMYMDSGTYVKSFYSVMYSPSCVKIRTMGVTNRRLHHSISWDKAAAKIIPERYKRANGHVAVRSPVRRNETKSSILETRPAKFLEGYLRYCEEAGADKAAVRDLVKQTILHLNSKAEQPELGVSLERQWYRSIQNGEPDWSVYSGDYYLAEAWVCWAVYSRKYIRSLCKQGGILGNSRSAVDIMQGIGSVLDLGCGTGLTSAAFTQLFPDAEVTGTNLEGTTQSVVAKRYGEVYGFNVREEPIGQADMVFASEYFEHIASPISHLQEVVEITKPRFIVFANTFNQRAIGHFLQYSVGGRMVVGSKMPRVFSAELKRLGFRKAKTKFWNNRPSVWVRE